MAFGIGGGGMDLGQLAYKVGKTSRKREMEDEMKRRHLSRMLDEVSQQQDDTMNPVLEEYASRARHTPGVMNGLNLGLGGIENFRGGKRGMPNNVVTGTYPGAPSYYGENWGQTDLNAVKQREDERAEAAHQSNLRTNATQPSDAEYQAAKQAAASKSSDDLYAYQKALNAKYATPAAAPAAVATSGAGNADAASKTIMALEIKKAEAAQKGETTAPWDALIAQQRAKVATTAAPAGPAAGAAWASPDPLGVSLAGNTPAMLSAIQGKLVDAGSGVATAPVSDPTMTLQPSHAGGVPIDLAADVQAQVDADLAALKAKKEAEKKAKKTGGA